MLLILSFQARSVLDFLILERSEFIKTCVTSLDPLPDTETFKHAREQLNKYKYSHGKYSLKKVLNNV